MFNKLLETSRQGGVSGSHSESELEGNGSFLPPSLSGFREGPCHKDSGLAGEKEGGVERMKSSIFF